MGSGISRRRHDRADTARVWLQLLPADVVGEIGKYCRVHDRAVLMYACGRLRADTIDDATSRWCTMWVEKHCVNVFRSSMTAHGVPDDDDVAALCAHWDAIARIQCKGNCAGAPSGADAPCACESRLVEMRCEYGHSKHRRHPCKPGKCLYMYEYVGDLTIGRSRCLDDGRCDRVALAIADDAVELLTLTELYSLACRWDSAPDTSKTRGRIYEFIRIMRDHKCSVSIRDRTYDGVSALMIAASRANVDALKKLLGAVEDGEYLRAVDRRGRTALHYACRSVVSRSVSVDARNRNLRDRGLCVEMLLNAYARWCPDALDTRDVIGNSAFGYLIAWNSDVAVEYVSVIGGYRLCDLFMNAGASYDDWVRVHRRATQWRLDSPSATEITTVSALKLGVLAARNDTRLLLHVVRGGMVSVLAPGVVACVRDGVDDSYGNSLMYWAKWSNSLRLGMVEQQRAMSLLQNACATDMAAPGRGTYDMILVPSIGYDFNGDDVRAREWDVVSDVIWRVRRHSVTSERDMRGYLSVWWGYAKN